MTEHNQMVKEFFDQQKKENPEKYEEVASKYPLITSRRINSVRRRELTVGLLGLMPARIDLVTANAYDIESELEDTEQ